MIRLPGEIAKDLCDSHLKPGRRDFLRVGGAGMLGMTLNNILAVQNASAASGLVGRPGWGKAKSVIMVYLQGGPSHIDLFDPKPDAPDKVRSIFKPIHTKTDGLQFTELLPRLAKVTDKFTTVRSMSYTPNGLFNHTAAIYQIMTGYTTDKVSPSGQLEPPSPKDFPNFGSNIIRLKPSEEPMLPFVVMPRPLQESNVINKGGTAGFLGKAYDPYYLFPDGDDMDMTKMSKIRVDDLQLRPDVFSLRLQRRAKLRDALTAQMPVIEKAVENYNLDDYYDKALNLIVSGRARDAFQLDAEDSKLRDAYGRNTFGQSCLLARRLSERGVRFVQVYYGNGQPWDTHSKHDEQTRKLAGDIDRPVAALLEDLKQRGLLDETLVIWGGEFGRTPVSENNNGRDHNPHGFAMWMAGGGVRGGYAHGATDEFGFKAVDKRMHVHDLHATILHLLGIDHERLTFRHAGRDFRLTDVHGKIARDILT